MAIIEVYDLPLIAKIRRIKRKVYYTKRINRIPDDNTLTTSQNKIRLIQFKAKEVLRLYGDYKPFTYLD